MRFIITGANGFIGSYLCLYLVKNGHQVVAISRKFNPGVLSKFIGITSIEKDILNPDTPEMELDADCIIHLASANDIVSANRTEGIKLSVEGTINMLQLAVNRKIPKFIFFSTLQVYGTNLTGEYSVNSKVTPENDYALNHLFAEQYVEMFSRKFPIITTVVRPSNIYGTMVDKQIDRWNLVPGCFIKEGIEKGTITLASSGNQLRNFVSLEKVSESCLEIANSMTQPLEIVNLVSDNYYQIKEVAYLTKQLLEEALHKKMEIIFKSNLPEKSNEFSFPPIKRKSNIPTTSAIQDSELAKEIKGLIKLYLHAI